MKIRKAVIPAAGFGTRFLPVTKVVPKELLPVGAKPAIQYVVEEAVAAGIEEVIFVCRPSREMVADYFRPDEEFESFLERRGKKEELEEVRRLSRLVDVRVAYQKEPLGLGHSIFCARGEIGDESFLILLPDMIVNHEDGPSRQLVEACGDGWGVTLMQVPRDKVASYGIVDAEGIREGVYRIRGAVEKPLIGEAPSQLAILGRYCFPPEIFSLIERSRPGALGEVQLTDAINALARERPGIGVVCSGKIYDVGTPEGMRDAQELSAVSNQQSVFKADG